MKTCADALHPHRGTRKGGFGGVLFSKLPFQVELSIDNKVRANVYVGFLPFSGFHGRRSVQLHYRMVFSRPWSRKVFSSITMSGLFFVCITLYYTIKWLPADSVGYWGSTHGWYQFGSGLSTMDIYREFCILHHWDKVLGIMPFAVWPWLRFSARRPATHRGTR